MTDDITFCKRECVNVTCMRHPSNIIEKFRPHSFAYFEDCEDFRPRIGKKGESDGGIITEHKRGEGHK